MLKIFALILASSFLPPATEKTLDIPNISVYNFKELMFPAGHVLPMGQPGDINEYSPSEAWGYAIRNAAAAKDKEFFTQLVQSFLYYSNQTAIVREGHQFPLSFGLMGWSPNMVSGNYQGGTQFFSSASDADEDILNGMMKGWKAFGNLEITDPLSDSSNPNVVKSISLHDLILKAAGNFIANELGTIKLGNYSGYMLTLDNWGHDTLNPDYFDPQFFADLIAFYQAEDPVKYSSQIQSLQEAADNTMTAIAQFANSFGGWIPDGPYSQGSANTFGYDAVRILMRFGEYLMASQNKDPLGLHATAKTVLANLINNIIPLCSVQNGTYLFSGTGLSRGQFTGPLLVALTALQKENALPPNASGETVKTVEQCFEHDLTDYDISSMANWQNNSYFCMQLALLSQAIIKSPGV